MKRAKLSTLFIVDGSEVRKLNIEHQHLAMVFTSLITAVGTFLATKSTNKVTLENENIKNATSLYEQYKELNQQLQHKVEKLEDKVEKIQEKYEKEINFYKLEIEKLEIHNEVLQRENENLRTENIKLKEGISNDQLENQI